MRVLIFLGIFVVFSCGFGHVASAQQIFITKQPTNSGDVEQLEGHVAPTIFLKPKTNAGQHFSPSKPSVSYGEKLELAQAQQYSAEAAKIYEQWQTQGFKPQTLEERLAYSKVRRTVKFAPMLERQEKLIQHLESR